MNRLHTYQGKGILLMLLLPLLMLLSAASAGAQELPVRYVAMPEDGGSYLNDGLSWNSPKGNIQDAITELRDYMVRNHLSRGQVYVRAGVYHPSRSTEDGDAGQLFSSFLLYEGIELYGGFRGDEKDPSERLLINGRTETQNFANRYDNLRRVWEFKYPTVLSGDLGGNATYTGDIASNFLRWDSSRQQYAELFTGNTYHVVWFATNGFHPTDNPAMANRAKGLATQAVVDGFTITGGCASNSSVSGREHTAYGGGVYMVDGALLRKCVVTGNAATRRGGGVYCDGGGLVEDCFITANQAAGLGLADGMGGGIAIDHFGQIFTSVIADNAARLGGGISIAQERDTYPDAEPGGANYRNAFASVAAGCLIVGNTASADGGGLHMLNGGTVNHVSIVRNHCSGPLVTVNNRRYGRSGGMFIDTGGTLFNSVVWGNTTRSNENVQYASYSQLSNNAGDRVMPYISFSAFAALDDADWTNTFREQVVGLDVRNKRPHSTRGSKILYPDFYLLAEAAGAPDVAGVQCTVGAGKPTDGNTADWTPLSYSDLVSRGISLRDYITDEAEAMAIAAITTDMNRNYFSPLSTLGAFLPARITVKEADNVPGIENPAVNVPTIFVDPEYNRAGDGVRERGDSWDNPLIYLADALNYASANPQKHFQILVKQGTLIVGNRNANVNADSDDSTVRLRDLTERVPSGTSLYGGFESSLTGVSTSLRNPKEFPSIISANISGRDYNDNVANIMTIENVSHVTVDGFHLLYANSVPESNLHLDWQSDHPMGGGIYIRDAADITLRSLLIAHCTTTTGGIGAAIYAANADGLHAENLIVHNNTSGASDPSAIYLTGATKAELSHSLVRGNVGCITADGAVQLTISSTAIHANGTAALQDLQVEQELPGHEGSLLGLRLLNGATVDVSRSLHNLGDLSVESPCFTRKLSLTQAGAPEGNTDYPWFVNPTTSVGANPLGDVTIYGGAADFTPLPMNPMVNFVGEADPEGDFGGQSRDFGGAADTGALECTDLPEYGKCIYVRDYRLADGSFDFVNKGGDGSSWATAINGNCTAYANDHGFLGVDAELYPEDSQLTGLQWAVDEAYARSLRKDADGKFEMKPVTSIPENKALGTPAVSLCINDGNYTYNEGTIYVSTPLEQQRVKIWVAKGEYLSRNGFFMRDGVDVLGGFPSFGNPGEDEREPRKYETIIETNTNEDIETGYFEWGIQTTDEQQQDYNPYPAGTTTTLSKSGWKVYYTSQHSTYNATRIVDGNTSNYWRSYYTGTIRLQNVTPCPHVIIIDMGKEQTFTTVTINQGGTTSYYIKSGQVYAGNGYNNSHDSNNKLTGTYTTGNGAQSYLVDGIGGPDDKCLKSGSWNQDQTITINCGAPVTARYLKIFIDDVYSNNYKVAAIGEVTLTYNDGLKPNNYDLNYYTNAYRTKRVLTQPFPYFYGSNLTKQDTEIGIEFRNEPANPFNFVTTWDGLSIRNGRTQNMHQRDGGAGVALRYRGRIENCLIYNNVLKSYFNLRGGGIFLNGGEIANCQIYGNQLLNPGRFTEDKTALFGGGIYLRDGVVYNSVFYDNLVQFVQEPDKGLNNITDGSGAFFENGRFFNNTLTRNYGSRAVATGNWFSNGRMLMYNTIIYGNYDRLSYKGTDNFAAKELSVRNSNGGEATVKISHCLLQDYQKLVIEGKPDISKIMFYKSEGPKFVDFSNQENPDFHLLHDSPAINVALESMLEEDGTTVITLPEYDADYTARVKDCALDLGAYEYDGSVNIAPSADPATGGHVFYVSETGYGVRDASSPANAACWQKLQKVLDAAGRLVYEESRKAPQQRKSVTVRLASFDGYVPLRQLTYDDEGSRVIAATASNPRAHSILVPRGVTLEGGWNDGPTTAERFTERDPLKYSTTLDGRYSSGGNAVQVYHTLSFTRQVYDDDESPKKGDDGKSQRLLADDLPRAVVDGFRIINGEASGLDKTRTEANSGSVEKLDNYSPDNYGGAAIVPSYAHIRNCIIENNSATAGGGALFLRPRALVSGCVFRFNRTDGDGGAIYVYEPDEEIDGDMTPEDPIDPSEDINLPAIAGPKYPYANIFTSTIVGNSAAAGGGVYFTNNLRLNSSVLWCNTANSNSNISGQMAPGSGERDLNPWEYPLQYCAVEHRHAPGYNNFSVHTLSEKGVRWDHDNYSDNEAIINDPEFTFLPMSYSLLARAGMRMDDYVTISTSERYFPTLAANDIAGVNLTKESEDIYIDVGARTFDGLAKVVPSPDRIMTRIYVAQAEDVTIDPAVALMNLEKTNYYSQEGSSMAYPFNRLGDALEYVRNARVMALEPGNAWIADTKFEIFVSRGTHTPYRSIKGVYANSRANTFLVPEGVAIYGGISPFAADDDKWLGKAPAASGAGSGTEVVNGVTLYSPATTAVLDGREFYDVNQNGIIEGWGLEYQTILSGNVVNNDENSNVFHVITSMAAEEYVGKLPTPLKQNPVWDGSSYKERGVPIILDGLQITGGQAMNYDLAVQSNSTYYKGGAICVDGNWYSDRKTVDGQTVYTDHHHETDGLDLSVTTYEQYDLAKRKVGYRDIPLVVRNSLITGNSASMGGAIFSNGELHLFSTQFAANTAMRTQDEGISFKDGADGVTMIYPGRGGAIDASSLLVAVNCIFANNTADSGDGDNTDAPQGTGGAIALGEHAALEMVNCHVVNNQADAYPAIYAWNPNLGFSDINDVAANAAANPHQIVNTIFWGNENTDTNIVDGRDRFAYLMNLPEKGAKNEYPEALWFCAYENDRWHPSVSVADETNDFRSTPYLLKNDGEDVVDMKNIYVPYIMHKVYGDKAGLHDVSNYNFNIIVSDDNKANNGPNFINPSLTSGAEGYMLSADWMMGRINNLVDRGWTFLEQEIDDNGARFLTDEAGLYRGSGIYLEMERQLAGSLTYEGAVNMPVGDRVYMYYDRQTIDSGDSEQSRMMLRVSRDPNPTHQQTFIDIGAYEYQHVQLKPVFVGEEVDILWVTPTERQDVGVPDGSTWLKATSDLQRAIETLLCSRNDHHKEIRLLGGDFVPVYTFGENMSFYFSTGQQDANVMLPQHAEEGHNYGVRSFTIRGGYSNEFAGNYDPVKYESRMMMVNRAGATENVLQHLSIVEDARERRTTFINNKGESVREHEATDRVIPIVLEGITFTNSMAFRHDADEGGAAIFYKDQKKKDSGEDGSPLNAPSVVYDSETLDNKLTIRNCRFELNAVPGQTSVSAVTIGEGGGGSLIANTLFNDNSGPSLTALGTNMLNCTVARNNGPVTLGKSGAFASNIVNSLLWMNGAVETAGEFTLRNSAVSGLPAPDEVNHNDPLGDVNNDVISGPNFIDPDNRDYGVLSSAMVTSRASYDLYNRMMLNIADNSQESFDAAYEVNTDMGILALSGNPEGLTDNDRTLLHNPRHVRFHDLNYKPRLYDTALDRGAYETQAKQRRLHYVISGQQTNGTGTGWADAYGGPQLQTAVNAAAVYSYANSGRKAYVFVKGSANHMASLQLQKGVEVYGSIQPAYTEESASDSDSEVEAYVAHLLSDRDRTVAGTYSATAKVASVSVSTAGAEALLDGFEITPPEGVESVNGPAVSVAPEVSAAVIRNCVVHGFNSTVAATPVIAANGGTLIYNSLLRDARTAENVPLVLLSPDAYMLNCTVGASQGATPVNPDASARVLNCVVHTANEVSPFAPYLQDPNQRYQLHEKAAAIAAGSTQAPGLLPESLRQYVDFSSDRDLLGNPRLTHPEGTTIDLGCFETWICGGGSNPGLLEPSTAADLYAGNYYPHQGSVVYILNGGAMSLMTDGGQRMFCADGVAPNPFRPAYLLLEEGGSLYGNGNDVQLSYTALQRELQQPDALVALPYPFKPGKENGTYSAIGSVSYSPSGAVSIQPMNADEAAIYTYNAARRSASNYIMVDSNSPCWESFDGAELPTTSGWLLSLGESGDENFEPVTVRFTVQGENVTDFLYEEGVSCGNRFGDSYDVRGVTLRQNDRRNPAGVDFTTEYNMGWNLIGLPWLVSGYSTELQMDAPHIIYDLRQTGGYAASRSWTDGTTIGAGRGVFTQTFTIDAEEEVRFAMPIYGNAPSMAPQTPVVGLRRAGDLRGMADMMTLIPCEIATSVTYSAGRDGAKLMAMNSALPQLSAVTADGLQASLIAMAPYGTEIPVALDLPDDGDYEFYLPCAEAFGCDVYLTDHLTGEVHALSDSDVAMRGVTFSASDGTGERFTIRLGGSKVLPMEAQPKYRCHSEGLNIVIEGVEAGDSIIVHDMQGRTMEQTRAEGTTHMTQPMDRDRVYLIRINATPIKYLHH